MKKTDKKEGADTMASKESQWVWVKVPQKAKLKANDKDKILRQVNEFISTSHKMKQRISRVSMRGAWIYFYELFEPHKSEGAIFTKPLINDKYLEFKYARITLRNVAVTDCDLDWQRHNEQWMTLYSGTLHECLEHIENNDEWFQ